MDMKDLIQDKIIGEKKKSSLKKNNNKKFPFKKKQVNFSPKLLSFTEETSKDSKTEFKIEEQTIVFESTRHLNSIRKNPLKGYRSQRTLKMNSQNTKDFEFDEEEKKKLYRVMTINPEKEILLFFYLEKNYSLPKGQYYVSGSNPDLGDWDIKKALRMRTKKRNGKEFYVAYIKVRKNNFPLEYKYFAKMKKGEIIWIGKAFENYFASEEVFTFMLEMSNKKSSILMLNTFCISDTINYDNSWKNRKEFIIPFILKAGSDIIFFQDLSRNKYNYILHRIDAIYEFIGFNRDDIEDNQYNLIAYNKNKYTLQKWGRFWLSTTPGVPDSNDLGNKYPRNCIWASLKKIDEYSCLYFNVEMDKNNYSNYPQIIEILLKEITKVMKKNTEENFIFLGGIFYVQDKNDINIKKILDFGFTEIPFSNTYHGTYGNENKNYDYFFYIDRTDSIKITQFSIFTNESIINKNKNSFISDHYPVKIEYIKNYLK